MTTTTAASSTLRTAGPSQGSTPAALRGEPTTTPKEAADAAAETAALLADAAEAVTDSFGGAPVGFGDAAAAVAAIAARQHEGPTPPAAPKQHILRPTLNPAQRALLHEANVANMKAYAADYGAYVDAYRAAVETAPGVPALRALGKLASPATLPPPQAYGRDDAHLLAEYTSQLPRMEPSDALMALVARKTNDLLGRRTVGAELVVGVDANVGPLSFGDSVAFADDGSQKRAPAQVGVSIPIGRAGVSMSVDEKGRMGVGARTATGGGISANARGVGGSIGVGPVSLGMGRSKDLLDHDLSVRVGTGWSFSDDADAPRVLGVGARAAIAVHLPTRADAAQFASTSDVGFFDAPAELKTGASWTKLPPASKERYEALGWTEREWTSRATLRLPLLFR